MPTGNPDDVLGIDEDPSESTTGAAETVSLPEAVTTLIGKADFTGPRSVITVPEPHRAAVAAFFDAGGEYAWNPHGGGTAVPLKYLARLGKICRKDLKLQKPAEKPAADEPEPEPKPAAKRPRGGRATRPKKASRSRTKREPSEGREKPWKPSAGRMLLALFLSLFSFGGAWYAMVYKPQKNDRDRRMAETARRREAAAAAKEGE